MSYRFHEGLGDGGCPWVILGYIQKTAKVLLSPEAQAEFMGLPKSIRPRVLAVFVRLEAWPDVSGIKWLKYEWTGFGRIRVGDWRVVFQFVAPNVIVVRIQNRRDVYED